MLALKVVVMDAELNFSSNGDSFKMVIRQKVWGLAKILIFGLVYPADIHF